MATSTSFESFAPATSGRHRVRGWRRFSHVVFALVIVAISAVWFEFLRPQAIGGPAGYVMVRGVSMEPVYHAGDLVLVRRRSSYAKGEIIAYRIPAKEIGAGLVVIHRILGGNPTRGFVTQGGNNPSPDDWHPKTSDILGTPLILVPKMGALLAFLHDPLPLASLSAGVAVALFLSSDPKKARTRRATRRGKRGPSKGQPALAGSTRVTPRTRSKSRSKESTPEPEILRARAAR